MKFGNKNLIQTIIGTNAERVAMSTVDLPQLTTFIESDTNAVFTWEDSSWVASGTNAGTQVSIASSVTLPVSVAPSLTTLTNTFGRINGALTTVTLGVPNSTYLRKLRIDLSANAIQTTAGIITMTITLNGLTLLVMDVFVPAVAGSGVGTINLLDRNFDVFSEGTGTTGLVVTLSAALTGGSLSINAATA